ncbi:hypothetical protein Hanom_Chr15g01373001 [Helianthus anomalus]
MENFSRNLSRNLSRSVSTAVDRSKVWRRAAYGGFDGGRSVKTIRLGEDNHTWFGKIKNAFNFTKSRKHDKDTSKARRSSKIASSNDEFQSRLLSEIYKSMSSTHELSRS